MKRLIVVAEHPLVGRAVGLALRHAAGLRVVGFLDGDRNVAAELAQLRPDVVIVVDMADAWDALARIREASDAVADAKVVLLTFRLDDEWLDRAFDAGASAVVSRAVHEVTLGTLLREIVNGTVVHRPRQARERVQPASCPLTDRELEILRLAAHGHTNCRIAAELSVTEQTVKFHLTNTYRKLGVANRTEASRYAHVNDLLALPDAQLAS
jgi:DNA-binding NarL/FixJ family response regulator